MNAYAVYFFERVPETTTKYVLKKTKGTVNIPFEKYKNTQKNMDLGIAEREYVTYSEPRDERIRQYFAHTFELGNGKVLTSTEELDSKYRTFGDLKKVGLNDLVLIQFNFERTRMVMWFVKDKGVSREIKKRAYERWICGDTPVYEEK